MKGCKKKKKVKWKTKSIVGQIIGNVSVLKLMNMRHTVGKKKVFNFMRGMRKKRKTRKTVYGNYTTTMVRGLKKYEFVGRLWNWVFMLRSKLNFVISCGENKKEIYIKNILRPWKKKSQEYENSFKSIRSSRWVVR